MGVMKQVLVEGTEIGDRVVVVEVGHLGVSEGGIISKGLLFFRFCFFRPVEVAVDDMDLSSGFQIGKGQVQDLLNGRCGNAEKYGRERGRSCSVQLFFTRTQGQGFLIPRSRLRMEWGL